MRELPEKGVEMGALLMPGSSRGWMAGCQQLGRGGGLSQSRDWSSHPGYSPDEGGQPWSHGHLAAAEVHGAQGLRGQAWWSLGQTMGMRQ